MVSLAAEFPNDNPALHCGASWVCLEVTGLPVAIRAASSPEPAQDVAPVTSPADSVSVPSLSLAELITADTAEPLMPEPAIPLARISEIVALGITPREDSEGEHELGLDLDEPFLVEDLPPLEESASLEGVELAPTTTIVPTASDDPWTVFVAALVDVAMGAGSPHVASVLPTLLLDGTLAPMPEDAAAALAEAPVVRDGAVTPTFLAQTRAWRAILLGTGDDFEACGGAMLDEWGADLVARLLGAPSRATVLRRELRSHGVAAFGLASAA